VSAVATTVAIFTMASFRVVIIGLGLVGLVTQAAAQSISGNEPPIVDPLRGAVAPAAQVQLTPEQKLAIVNAVRSADPKPKGPENLPTSIGAQLPPQTELYFLSDKALASAPEAPAAVGLRPAPNLAMTRYPSTET
jgi:hypothetical protein